MAPTPAKFVWYDLMTTDMRSAQSFYGKVVGWTAQDAGAPGRLYTLFCAGPAMVGGLMPLPDEARAMGTPPCWTGYVGVGDVDAHAARVRAAGGTVHRPPEDIPGIGRFAVVADPHGAVFILFRGNGTAPAEAPAGTAGHIGWHELQAGDGAAAFAFYSALFGWTKDEAIDMGPMGTYQLFATGGAPVGGIMNKMPEAHSPFWLYYFNVDAIDAAAKRTTDAGGQVINGPMEVPGGSWIVQCLDPQGAMFAMVAAKR